MVQYVELRDPDSAAICGLLDTLASAYTKRAGKLKTADHTYLSLKFTGRTVNIVWLVHDGGVLVLPLRE